MEEKLRKWKKHFGINLLFAFLVFVVLAQVIVANPGKEYAENGKSQLSYITVNTDRREILMIHPNVPQNISHCHNHIQQQISTEHTHFWQTSHLRKIMHNHPEGVVLYIWHIHAIRRLQDLQHIVKRDVMFQIVLAEGLKAIIGEAIETGSLEKKGNNKAVIHL